MNIKVEIKKLFNSHFVKALVSYSTVILFTKALNFIFQSIVSRKYGPTQYGEYSLYVSYQNILATVIGFNLMASFSIIKPGLSSAEFKNTVNNNFVINNILFFILSIAAIPLLNIFIPGEHSQYFAIFCYFSAYGYQALFYYLNYKLFERDYQKYSLLYLIWGVFQNLLLLLVAFFDNKRNIDIIIAIATLGNLLLAVVYSFGFIKKSKLNFITYFKTVIIILPITISSLAGTLLSQNGRVQLSKLIGLEQVGLYSFASNIGMMVYLLNTTINKAWAPEFLNRMSTAKQSSIRNSIAKLLALYGVLSLLFMSLTYDISFLIGGKMYESAHSLAKVFVLSEFVAFLYSLISNYFFYTKKTLILSIIVLTNVILNIFLNRILIPLYGINIVTYNTVISYIYAVVFSWIYLKKKTSFLLLKLKEICGLIVIMFLSNMLFELIESRKLHIMIYIISKFGVVLFGSIGIILVLWRYIKTTE